MSYSELREAVITKVTKLQGPGQEQFSSSHVTQFRVICCCQLKVLDPWNSNHPCGQWQQCLPRSKRWHTVSFLPHHTQKKSSILSCIPGRSAARGTAQNSLSSTNWQYTEFYLQLASTDFASPSFFPPLFNFFPREEETEVHLTKNSLLLQKPFIPLTIQ